MLTRFVNPRGSNNFVKRSFSSTAASPARSYGSTFFQRLNSFLVGTGIGFGTSFYFVHQEVKDSNATFEKYLDKLEGRIKALENKK